MKNITSFRRILFCAAFAASLALLPACGSKDERPLVLVDTPAATYAGSGTSVVVKVVIGSETVAQQTYTLTTGSTGKLGVYLPSGTNGDATIVVSIVDASGCVIATGSSAVPVAVKAGEVSAVVSISLTATGGCPGGVDGGTVPSVDGSVDRLNGSTDGGSPGIDASSDHADAVGALDTTSAPVDVALPLEDTAGPVVDAPLDLPAVVDSLPVGPEVGPEAAADGPTSMNVFANCTKYTHSKLLSDGGPQNWGIRQLGFTPDGKYLISFGEDYRAKLWAVSASGLTDTGIVFSGTNSLYGSISRDGKYVAIGDGDSLVNVYDLPATIQYGTPSLKWSLPPDTLSPKTYETLLVQFTTDGNHVVVVYRGDVNANNPNQLVVWDLTTQQAVRVIKYEYRDVPMAVFPGDYTGAMWVASRKSVTNDAGNYESTLSLMDVAQAAPAKAQVVIAGSINDMTFSPDGTTLAVAFDSGEVSLWDITNKATIAKLGSPIVGAASRMSAYSLAYSADGKYLAAGIGDYFGSSTVNLTLIQQRVSLQKGIDYLPWSLALKPDGLGLAVGEGSLGVLIYCRP